MVSPNRERGYQFQALARQGSVYNPSFDEVKSQMGNNIGNTMNLNDQLVIKNVEDHGQIVQNSSSSSSSSSLPPAASYFLGNGRLSKKTIDEVWKHINNETDNQPVHQQQQLTLGETTLEDFLLRAGVITIGNNNQNGVVNHHHHQPFMAIDPMVVVSQQADWSHFQMADARHHHYHHQMTEMDTSFNVYEPVYENPVADIGYSDNQLALTMPVPATPSNSKVNNERKRRFSDEIMEKTIERRQKRMIKNRESAARSRARKQAYTNQLESQVLRLRKRNSSLKKQKEVEMVLSANPTPISKYQLRRTSSV